LARSIYQRNSTGVILDDSAAAVAAYLGVKLAFVVYLKCKRHEQHGTPGRSLRNHCLALKADDDGLRKCNEQSVTRDQFLELRESNRFARVPRIVAKPAKLREGSCVTESGFSRRRFLRSVAVAAAPLAFLARVQTLLGGDWVELEPTPAIREPLEITPQETAGPFFRPDSPLKADFRESGLKGAPTRVSGFVLDCKGKPVRGALLDFWHADGDGEYDLQTFRCRGHQFSDASGRYTLETIAPGMYPGRTRHYHVRLQAPHGPILCTQLYFPGETRNASDPLFRPDLLLNIRQTNSMQLATFNFVLELA
jgi:protocatechuate 3,4-dioxygenase beta subunit